MFQKLVLQSAEFPISLFSVVVGYLGLAYGYQLLERNMGFAWPVSELLLLIGVLLFIAFTFTYFLKLFFHFTRFVNELKGASEGNFFSSISISMILLGVMFQPLSEIGSIVFWSVGSILQFVITIYIVRNWIYQSHWQVTDLNPVWFLPVVGVLVIPLGLPQFLPVELGWFFLSIGLIFWLILFSLILYRLFFHPPLASYLEPTLFILIAPPALGFLSYLALNVPLASDGALEVDLVARVLFYTGLFLSFLLLSKTLRFSKIPFSLASWASVFPLTMMAVASLVMFEHLNLVFYGYLGGLLLSLLSVLVLHLTLMTFLAWKHQSLHIMSKQS